MQIKSLFQFTSRQRNGIFLLLTLIVLLQCVYFFIDNDLDTANIENELALNAEALHLFEVEIDSLKKIKAEANTPKIYPFNPNFITDYKGYILGMTNKEIDRLHHFRKQNKWVNSAKMFQQVTKISDSLLAILSPNFKFPEWVKSPKRNHTSNPIKKENSTLPLERKIDLNKATVFQLKKVNGIGDKLSQRIIAYRNSQNGFISEIELQEIYGLSQEVIAAVKKQFTVKSPRDVKKISLNTATRDELVKIKYIDYDIAYNIIEARTLRAGYNSLDDLRKVKDFPIKKIEIIKLYLQLN